MFICLFYFILFCFFLCFVCFHRCLVERSLFIVLCIVLFLCYTLFDVLSVFVLSGTGVSCMFCLCVCVCIDVCLCCLFFVVCSLLPVVRCFFLYLYGVLYVVGGLLYVDCWLFCRFVLL